MSRNAKTAWANLTQLFWTYTKQPAAKTPAV